MATRTQIEADSMAARLRRFSSQNLTRFDNVFLQVEPDAHGVTLVMEACQHAQRELLEYLLQYPTSLGLRADATDDVGRNALFYVSDAPDAGTHRQTFHSAVCKRTQGVSH